MKVYIPQFQGYYFSWSKTYYSYCPDAEKSL